MLPGALPIWNAFARLSRGRDVTAYGIPLPLKYRDVRDMAERVRADLPAETIERIIETLDDTFLESIPRDHNSKRRD